MIWPDNASDNVVRRRQLYERGLVTNNRATMPVHLQAHLTQERHVPGIVQLPRRMNVGAILDDLLLIASASLPDEFQDQIVYLPL